MEDQHHCWFSSVPDQLQAMAQIAWLMADLSIQNAALLDCFRNCICCRKYDLLVNDAGFPAFLTNCRPLHKLRG